MDERARWKNKIDALLRLAEDQRGKPEGELAREKLDRILRMYPLVRQYQPVQEFMMSDLRYMKEHGISTDGHWEGDDLNGAMAAMIEDYRRRIESRKVGRLLGEREVKSGD